MDLNERQRLDLARRIRSQRLRRFKGNRKAAYTEAKVNADTWARAEGGMSLAERSLVAIVETLWPATGGDWQLMDPPLGSQPGEVNVPRTPRTDEERKLVQAIREAEIDKRTRESLLRVLGEEDAG